MLRLKDKIINDLNYVVKYINMIILLFIICLLISLFILIFKDITHKDEHDNFVNNIRIPIMLHSQDLLKCINESKYYTSKWLNLQDKSILHIKEEIWEDKIPKIVNKIENIRKNNINKYNLDNFEILNKRLKNIYKLELKIQNNNMQLYPYYEKEIKALEELVKVINLLQQQELNALIRKHNLELNFNAKLKLFILSILMITIIFQYFLNRKKLSRFSNKSIHIINNIVSGKFDYPTYIGTSIEAENLSNTLKKLEQRFKELTTEFAQHSKDLKLETASVKLLHNISSTINQDNNIQKSLFKCLKYICEYTGWQAGRVFNPKSNKILKSSIWYFVDVQKYQNIENIMIHNKIDHDISPSLRAYNDLKSQTLVKKQNFLEYPDKLDKFGIKSIYSFPIILKGKIVAILEFYNINDEEPTTQILKIMDNVAYQISYIIQRYEGESKLKDAIAEAHSANDAKSEFLATMSHELRTPLNGIIGFSKLLMDEKITLDQKEYAIAINKSGNNLLTIVNDILDLSKIESGMLELENIPFDLKKALNETINIFKPVIIEKNLCINLIMDEEVPSIVIGDIIKLQQILRNLINNSIKFTSKGSISVIINRESSSMKQIYFSVKDTGIGIAKDRLQKVFEKFVQADKDTTRNYSGTGLGLSICKQIVDLMGGKIGVESEVGMGSNFWFTAKLPKAKDNQVAVNAENNKNLVIDPKYSNINILVADDHPINLFFIRKLLQKLNFKNIITAKDGRDALERVRANKFDLFFIDCQMPNLDGYETTTIIRREEENTTDHLPIIAMTANAMKGDKDKCLRCGMDDYLSKPVKEEEVVNAMSKWFSFKEKDLIYTNHEINLDTNNKEENKERLNKKLSKHINLERLSEFTNNDPEEEKEIRDLFIGICKDSLKDLNDIMAKYDTQDREENNNQWRKTSHKLAGAVGNFGAFVLSGICNSMENAFQDEKEIKQKLLDQAELEFETINEIYNNPNYT